MTTSPLLSEPVPTPLAIVRALEQAGIEYVFGMSGGNRPGVFLGQAP